MPSDHLILASFWISWCFWHSLLISTTVLNTAQKILGPGYRFYRIGYNVFSIVSFAAVYWYSRGVSGDIFFIWTFPMVIAQWLGLVLAALVIYMGAREYDQQYFIGLRQIKEGIVDDVAFPIKRSGILKFIRHPYYTGGLLFLVFWGGEVSSSLLITKFILSAYLIIGAFLEERKLVALLGSEYEAYQREVPMFFPRLIRRK
jgi:methanethiol S-methyltransferase